MEIERFFDDDLAQCSYAVACPDSGEVAIIDPLRDIDQYLDWASERGWEITRAVETHIHADFLSGARELAAATGAQLIISAEAPPRWRYDNLDGLNSRSLESGDEFDVGNVTLRAFHTPGHTPEHLSYAIVDDDDEARFVFTGDFLFVDDLGRPDLLEKAAEEKDAAVKSAKQMYASIREFVDAVPAETVYWPGHGAGSACGKSQSSVPVSSVGREARVTWWSEYLDDSGSEDDFVDALLADQPEVPHYFARMKELNRDGMEMLGGLRVPPRLHPEHFRRLATGDRAVVVDVSDEDDFRARHAKGSLNLSLSTLSTYAGWVLRPDDSIALVCDPEEVELATRKLMRIGFDQLEGWIPHATHAPQSQLDEVSVDEFHELWRSDEVTVLDVRAESEFEESHIPGARHIHYGDIRNRLDDLDSSERYVVHCETGARSTVAASLMSNAGIQDIAVFGGSPDDWEEAGYEVE